MEVAHHLPDHRELLSVLLAEHGDVGPHQVEQGTDHGRDAAEVSGPADPLQPLGGAGGLDEGGVAGWIEGLHRRQEEEIAAGRLQQARVRLRLAGVAVEVLVGPELGRIHEHRRHYPGSVLAGEPHEGQMPRVERAHGGHEGDPLAGRPPGLDLAAEVGFGADGQHGDAPRGDAPRGVSTEETPWNELNVETPRGASPTRRRSSKIARIPSLYPYSFAGSSTGLTTPPP